MQVDWKQAAKTSAFVFAGRVAAEVLISRYRKRRQPDIVCPHIGKGANVRLRVIIHGRWHVFCDTCTDVYASVFEFMHYNREKVMVVGIEHIEGLRAHTEREARKWQATHVT